MATGTRKGREYLRVSKDRSGRERSQDEQHAANDKAAQAHGVTLSRPYRERGSRSASRYATKTRDTFGQLIKDLEADRFGAEVLVMWEASRGSRQVSEWVRLLELCEKRGVRILVTTHEREYNPGNSHDRKSLIDAANDSEYESSKLSDRLRRSAAAGAADGLPAPGRIAYGYARTYSTEGNRRVFVQHEHPVQGPVVREVFERLRQGHSLRAIAADLKDRGVVNRSGGAFSPQHLRNLARRPVYAGLRQHNDDPLTEGTWPALVPRAAWYAVQAMLDKPERKTTRPGGAKHLLSMIGRCSPCGDVLTATGRGKEPEYGCRSKGCVRVNKAELDALAEEAILDYLTRREYGALRQSTVDSSEIAGVQADLAEARSELAALRAAVGAGKVSVASLIEAEPGLLARVADAEARERELTTPSELAGLLPGKDVKRRWRTAEMSTKRAVARLLLVPGVLGELRVQRRPEGRRGAGHVPARERVTWLRDEVR